MTRTAVRVSGVVKRYGNHVAVDRVSFDVPTGVVYGVLGPNGAGKSTTLRMINDILRPDAGEIRLLGDLPPGPAAAPRIGYLPEERGLYKRMKVLPLIEYFARLKGCYDCRETAKQWLERLDAASWADTRLDSLSKGMAQKVQFIVAVIARPQVVILDEPFSGLDPVNLELLQDAVRTLRSEGATVVLSTHDMGVAERLCDAVFMIHEGRKVLDGTLVDIQRKYPVRCVRLRLADGAEPPPQLPSVATIAPEGRFWLLTLADGAAPQTALRQIAAAHDVEHFEVVRPTLHDIFVGIARPSGEAPSTEAA
jgi:ABC-2 type transport system ATP-binding protein